MLPYVAKDSWNGTTLFYSFIFWGGGGVQLTGQLNKGIRNKIEVTGSWKDQKKKLLGSHLRSHFESHMLLQV